MQATSLASETPAKGGREIPWMVEWPYVPPVMATGPTPSNS